MKIQQFQNKEEWLQARKGKITGSRLKDIISKRAGSGKKKGYYELIAERIAVEPTNENPMDRGSRLESEAMDRFMNDTGLAVDTSLVIWQREDDESIAISPDGFVGDETAVEVKCLNSASHIEAFLTQEIPDEYEYQKLQYFIVNDRLQKLNFVFYDPRISCKDYFVIEVYREEVQEEIDTCLKFEQDTLAEIDEVVNKLTNF